MQKILWAAFAAAIALIAQDRDLGFTDTPMLPGLPYHVHDPARPHPRVVTPGARAGDAPSDAVALFDSKDLSHWTRAGSNAPARWKVANGYVEVAGKDGIATKEKFGDVQLHVEWATPSPPSGTSQGRGNSGVFFETRYEVQVLDSYENPTYADGQAAAIYGQWPPLANASRKPGEWQTYDIVFEAPKFENGRLAKPAYLTVFHNGVLVQNHRDAMGPTVYRAVAKYVSQPAEGPILLQNHGNPVRYRNIWARRIPPYDQPER